MLRSGLDHRDVNMFTWVFDMLGCAITIRENRNQKGRRLFVYHEKEAIIYEVSAQMLNYLDDLVVRLQDEFLLFCACSANPHLSSQVISAVKPMSTLRTLQGEIFICICPFAA